MLVRKLIDAAIKEEKRQYRKSKYIVLSTPMYTVFKHEMMSTVPLFENISEGENERYNGLDIIVLDRDDEFLVVG